MSNDARVFRDLLTLHSEDPAEIRRRVLETVKTLAESDAAVAYGLVHDGEGPRVSDWSMVGDQNVEIAMERLASSPEVWPSQSIESFRNPPRPHRTSFILLEQLMQRRLFEESPLNQKVFAPLGLSDQTRFLAFHGNRFLASVIALRRGGPNFERRTAKRLSRGVAAFASALAAADALDSTSVPPAAFLVTTARGRVTLASESAADWLAQPGFREGLERAIRAFDASRAPERNVVLRRAAVSLVRLDGRAVRYLASVEPAPTFVIDPVVLLPRQQRRIAEYAAAGATVAEIARQLGRSENTVKTQLRIVFQRLGVASRLELARALARHEE